MWNALDAEAKQNFYKQVDTDRESSELKFRYHQVQEVIHHWEKEIERLR